MLNSVTTHKYRYLFIPLFLSFCLLSGCLFEPSQTSSNTTPSATNTPSIQNEEQKPDVTSNPDKEASSDSNKNVTPTNGRPVITHKYPVVIIEDGRKDNMEVYGVNVKSAIDPEDGKLPFEDRAFGLGGESEDEEENKRAFNELITSDSPEMVEKFGSGFYLSVSAENPNKQTGRQKIITLAYDSQGQLSTKEYTLVHLPMCNDATLPYATVLTEGLRVRQQPSTSSEIIGHVWKGAEYTLYESKIAENYTWYRIGKNLWIADNGKWLQIHKQESSN